METPAVQGQTWSWEVVWHQLLPHLCLKRIGAGHWTLIGQVSGVGRAVFRFLASRGMETVLPAYRGGSPLETAGRKPGHLFPITASLGCFRGDRPGSPVAKQTAQQAQRPHDNCPLWPGGSASSGDPTDMA